MFNSQTTALLRAVLDEVCENESGARAHVASKLLEAARMGERSVDDLRRIGRSALTAVPSMWQ